MLSYISIHHHKSHVTHHIYYIHHTSYVILHTSYFYIIHRVQTYAITLDHVPSCSFIYIYIYVFCIRIFIGNSSIQDIHKFPHNSVSFSIHRWSDHSPARRWHSWHDWQRATGPSDNYGLSRIARHFEIEVRCTRNEKMFFHVQIVQFTPINQKCRGFSWILMIRKGKRNVHHHIQPCFVPHHR